MVYVMVYTYERDAQDLHIEVIVKFQTVLCQLPTDEYPIPLTLTRRLRLTIVYDSTEKIKKSKSRLS